MLWRCLAVLMPGYFTAIRRLLQAMQATRNESFVFRWNKA